jgi:hypothetical protein
MVNRTRPVFGNGSQLVSGRKDKEFFGLQYTDREV